MMKILMAASYDIKNKSSWSGTPWSVYEGLCGYDGNEIDTVNLSDYHTEQLIRKNIFQHLDVKRSIKEKNPVSKLGPAVMNPLNSKIINKICKNSDYDVLIEFGGFLPGKNLPPYYIYTDSSHDMALDYYNKFGTLPFNNCYSLEEMRSASEFVRPIYQNAAGVFCMSRYLADIMVNITGVDENKVHTVYAGANWHGEKSIAKTAKSIKGKNSFELLLTGVDFNGKGVDIAIKAVEILNEKHSEKFRLHICGIKDYIPQNSQIINHGFVDKSKLSELLNLCDMFVLPSRFDCFGIAFVEAMAYGLPCVGRKICAMPEIIDEGVNGELIVDDNPDKLADLIYKICSDEQLYHSYSESAIIKSGKFTWDNVCEKIMNVIKNDNCRLKA